MTDNLFGDVLSDEAAPADRLDRHAAVGLAGRQASATACRSALYEPIHGSAPDIAGKGLANPIASILSFAMCLRYSFGMKDEAARLEQAVDTVLAEGYRTGDIMQPGMNKVGTTAHDRCRISQGAGRVAIKVSHGRVYRRPPSQSARSVARTCRWCSRLHGPTELVAYSAHRQLPCAAAAATSSV